MKYIKQIIKPFFDNRLTLPSKNLSLPTVTITGDRQISIEQHFKLLSFSEQEVKLQCEQGVIQIIGDMFVIKLMYPKEIILEGNIKEVNFNS